MTPVDDHEALTHLRSIVARGDAAGLVDSLRQEPWPRESLQLIGDALLAAARAGAEGWAAPTRKCVNALRERHWRGDTELADALEAVLGDGPIPLLRPLPVDLEEVAMILEGDPVYGGGRIDLRTGEVWPQAAIEYAEETGGLGEEDDEDTDRWLWVDCEGSRDSYQDMVWFIGDLDDDEFANRLARAISGRGAFRRFKDRLSERPELLAMWHAISDDRHRGRARSWLAAEGYTPTRTSEKPGPGAPVGGF